MSFSISGDIHGMIDYYSRLIGTLGGKVSAYCLDRIVVYHHGNIEKSKENIIKDHNMPKAL